MLADALPGDEQRALEAHVEGCPSCQQLLEELTRPLALTCAPTPDANAVRRVPVVPDARVPGLPSVPGYEVLGELGRGGMGVVYTARQVGLNRLVALKMIRDGELASPEQRLRFRMEAEMAARVRHPNVVQVHEVGEYQGRAYLAMELVEGGSLDQLLAGGPLPAHEAAAMAETLARAVHAAHLQGVIHRDLKPANVLLSAEGGVRSAELSAELRAPHSTFRIPKVTDFGLARPVE